MCKLFWAKVKLQYFDYLQEFFTLAQALRAMCAGLDTGPKGNVLLTPSTLLA